MADQTDNRYTWGNQVDGFLHTFTAEGAISNNQILELGTAGRQAKPHTTTQTVAILGVAHSDAADGEEITVVCNAPIRKVISDGNITRGEVVIPSAATAGQCASQAFADGETLYGALGIALETGDEAGELVPVLCSMPGIISNA